ncbi:MAG: peptidylprolyl isomerase, partial [Ferruginibacter sp.]
MKKLLFFFFSLAIFSVAPAQTKKSPVKKTATKKTVVTKKTAPKIIKVPVTVAPVKTDRTVRIKITTDSGIMVVKLYDSTPLHRDNFVKLVQQKFYDSLLFHRVIQGFMIQGGDPMSKNAPPAT